MLKPAGLLLLVGLAGFASGCGQTPTEAASAENSIQPAEVATTDEISEANASGAESAPQELGAYFIPDAVSFSNQEEFEVLTAYALLVQDCVSAAGIAVEVRMPDATGARQAEELRSLAFYFDDLKRLREVGYRGLADGPRLASASEPSFEGEPTGKDADEYAACHQDARSLLNGSESAPLDNVSPAAYEAESAMNVDMLKVLRPEMESWTKCMEVSEFPGSRVNYPPPGVETSPEAEQIAIEADFNCRLETGYTEALLKYRSERVAKYLSVDPASLAVQRSELDDELATARQILDAHGISHQ